MKATLASLCLRPCQVGILGIDTDGKDVGVECLELVMVVGERNDLRGTHKGKVQWVEKQDEIFA
jgi:hypothetical protein